MQLIWWTLLLILLQSFRSTASLFVLHKKFIHGVARQDTICKRETVTFNSSFIEFMFAFLGIAQQQCSCDDPCPKASKYVKLYIYNPGTNAFQKLFTNGSNAYLIDRHKPTTVFVHGFSDSFRPKRNSWNNQLCRIESKIFNRNTIALDWGKLSRCPYSSATEYLVPEIGYTLYSMLNNVLKVNLRQVHCVGHSLGSHICGYAGAASGGQFERCFGLDPAGIGYSVEHDGPSRGLNATCCQYVQAIHTDPQIGSLQAMGHIDFYPNNITGIQPHCTIQATGCAHQSVVEYYKAALDPSNTFLGRSCARSGKYYDPKMNCKFGPHNKDNCTGIACFDTSPCAPSDNTEEAI